MFAAILIGLLTLSGIQAQSFGQWCGKYYQVGAPLPTSRPAGSLYPYPSISNSPLLDFRCAAASSLYIKGDDANDPPMILIDANVTNDIGTAFGGGSGTLNVTVSTGSQTLTTGSVAVGSLGNLLSFNISSLTAQSSPYNLTCTASLNGQTFYANTTLTYLPPNPYGGNTVKIDRRSGALVVRNETAGEKSWTKIIPYGWYDSYNSTSDPVIYGPDFGKDAATDTLNRLRLAAKLGFKMVHPVPPGGFQPYTFDANATSQFTQWLDLAAQLGLYVQYDMRNSFLNLTSVQYQVEYLRNRSNILSWYTGDEPDGAVYALNSTKLAYDLINRVDGYHPVSLVLNCENYFFQDYGLNGADIIMVDPYPIAMNPSWSKPYGTPVNVNYGDSGCDNCNGTFYDISTRIDSTRNRARFSGSYRTKPAWIVPQAFNDGQQEFWYRVPTGSEGEAVTPILSINHGAMGSVAWNFQYSSMELLGNASQTYSAIAAQTSFLIDHADSRKAVGTNISYDGINGYDVASWTIPGNGTAKNQTLILAVNFNYGPNDAGPTWAPAFYLPNLTGQVKQVLFGNVTMNSTTGGPIFRMNRTSVAGVIVEG